MKKILLTLAAFIYVCSAPSFALKLILNDEKSRIVPSRLMGSYYNPSENVKDSSSENSSSQNSSFIHSSVYVIPGWKADEFDRLYKPLVGRDMRKELAGTVWDYPDYEAYRLQFEQKASSYINSRQFGSNQIGQHKFAKKYEREAADYFYRDTLNDPDKIIQSGYELIDVDE